MRHYLRVVICLSLLSFTTANASFETYVISDQSSCHALPVPTTWIAPAGCQIDGDLDLRYLDELEVRPTVDLLIPLGRELSVNASATIVNGGTITNDGVIVVTRIGSGPAGRIINNGALMNNATIESRGRLENHGVLINNQTIEFVGNSGRLENRASGTINNPQSIILDCDATFSDEGVFTGNPVDEAYCINNGDWSDPDAWNRGSLPPSNVRIFVDGTVHMDVDFVLSGELEVTEGEAGFRTTLVIDSGSDLEITADGFMTGRLFSTIINNHRIFNMGTIERGTFTNNADFGNRGIVNVNFFTNNGLFQNSAGGSVSMWMQNEADGIIDNFGIWTMANASGSHFNRGEFKNHENAELDMSFRVSNVGLGFFDNLGLISIDSSAQLTNGALISNRHTGSIVLENPGAEIVNVEEIRNEGQIGNNGAIDNTKGRICGGGTISGNPVLGNQPEAICNRAPTAVALPDAQVLECTGPTTRVTLDGRLSSDPDLRDRLTYSWSPSSGLIDPSADLTDGNFGLGSRNVELTVTDLAGASDFDWASFNVKDTTPPALTCPAKVTLVADEMCVGTGAPPLAEALDLCDTSPAVSRTPSGNSWPLGETEVTHSGTDGSGNTAFCASVVEVVDETLPDIQCNTGGIVRPGVPVSFQASATDNCSVASVAVTAFDCFSFNGAGIRTDKTDQCVVALSGDTIDIEEPSGVGTIISWTVSATDGSGNVATTSCEVTSTRPTRK